MKKRKTVLRELSKTLSFFRFFSKSPFRAFAFLVVLFFFLFLPGQGYYETLTADFREPEVRASEFDGFPVNKYPKNVGGEEAPEVTAGGAVVVDLESGVVLFEKNPEARLYPASLTKLMTALVALDYFAPEQTLTAKRLAPVPGESEMGLAVGDNLTLRNLLYGLLVSSGNDAAYTIADNYPGGIENFMYAMNKRAEGLHMIGTHFTNPSGLDSPKHFTSARDMAFLAIAALKNDLISKIVATYGITVTDATGAKSYTLRNVNQFLGYLYGADGVKTGTTDLAGQNLVASVSRNGHRVISVVLQSQDRFSDSGRLIEWVYRNFRWVSPTENGT